MFSILCWANGKNFKRFESHFSREGKITEARLSADRGLKEMKKKLEIDIPKGKNTEVTRKRSLKTTIFTRTRITALSVVLVIVLSITGTLAYLAYTANQTPNRMDLGEIGIKIVETTKVGSTTTSNKEFHDATDDSGSVNTADDGNGNKNAWMKATTVDGTGSLSEVVRMTIQPEIEYLDADKTTVLGNAFISEDWSAPMKDSNSKYYLKSDLLKIYLADDWASHYIYNNGTFIYNKSIKEGAETEKLVTGAEWADQSISRSDYGDIKVNIVAESIQATPEEAPAEWNLAVDDDGNVSVK